jgi:hypothetical protein
MNLFFEEYQDILKDRGFVYGGARLSPDNQHLYINIPKNASNYLDRVFGNSNWNPCNLMSFAVRELPAIVVLRDPLERWVSGATQYIVGNIGTGKEFSEHYNLLFERLLFDQVILDDHTMPQYYYFNEFPKANIRYYFLNTTLSDKIKQDFNLTEPTEIVYNKTVNDTQKTIISNHLLSRLNTDIRLLDTIKKRYSKDYDLINKVTFNN